MWSIWWSKSHVPVGTIICRRRAVWLFCLAVPRAVDFQSVFLVLTDPWMLTSAFSWSPKHDICVSYPLKCTLLDIKCPKMHTLGGYSALFQKHHFMISPLPVKIAAHNWLLFSWNDLFRNHGRHWDEPTHRPCLSSHLKKAHSATRSAPITPLGGLCHVQNRCL